MLEKKDLPNDISGFTNTTTWGQPTAPAKLNTDAVFVTGTGIIRFIKSHLMLDWDLMDKAFSDWLDALECQCVNGEDSNESHDHRKDLDEFHLGSLFIVLLCQRKGKVGKSEKKDEWERARDRDEGKKA